MTLNQQPPAAKAGRAAFDFSRFYFSFHRVKTVYGRIVLANHKSFRILSDTRLGRFRLFSHKPHFRHNGRIEKLIWRRGSCWFSVTTNIKRARFISISALVKFIE